MPVVVVDTDALAMRGLYCQLAICIPGDWGRGAIATYVRYDGDVHVSGLLGRVGRWAIIRIGIGQIPGLAASRFVSDLLSGRPLPFLTGLDIIFVLAI